MGESKMPDCSPKTDCEKEPKAEDDGIEDEVEEEKAPKAKGHDSGSADLEKVTDYAEDKEILSTGKDLEDALQAIRNKQAQKTVAATHVYSAYPYAHYPVAYYGKREAEAEADPALVYSTGLVGAYPYAVGAHAVTYAGAPHAVAHTPFGVTHSSNVGICTNYVGAVVPC